MKLFVGYSKAPDQPQSRARPICHSHTMTNSGREPATIRIAAYGQESKSAERYVRQGNVLPMATRTKISEVVFNERPVSIFLNNMYP